MADGKVTISTALDNAGLKKGIAGVSGSLGGLKSVLGKLSGAITAAFSVAAIVNFGKEASQAAMQLSDALTGLQSIVEGQGRSFSAAQAFIEEYTKDGLIPATNAITAYKNLAMRGYDDSQIRQVMVALKDASAYGRQASYTMGEAVESASEGLKNENSILVDNAGVTKNVAKMWEEYAASIGTTSNNLTQEQKIQAEVNGILAESKYQTGDAAKVAGTLSGQLQQMSFNFSNLKVAVGNFINPILQAFLPAVNAAIRALTSLANTIAAVINGLLGTSMGGVSSAIEEVSGGWADAEAGAESYGDAATKAGKAAKKALAGFDEITKLSDNSGGSGSSSGSTSGGGAVSETVTVGGTVDDQLSPGIQAVIDKIKELIAPLKEINLKPAAEAFAELKDAVSNFGEVLGDKLEWAWYNILVPLGKWVMEEAAPVLVELLANAFDALGAIIDFFAPSFKAIWDSFLKPLAKWTGGIIIGALEALSGALAAVAEYFNYTVADANALTEAEKELAEEAQKAAEAFEKQREGVEKNKRSIETQMGYATDLANELLTLADSSGKVEEKDRSRAKFILGELNTALGTEYDMVGGVIQQYDTLQSEIFSTIEAKKANLLLDASAELYTEALLEQEDAWKRIEIAEKDYLAQKKLTQELYDEWCDAEERYTSALEENGDRAAEAFLYEMQEAESCHNAAMELLGEKQDEWQNASSAYTNYSNTIIEYETAAQRVIEGNYQDAVDILSGKKDAYGQYADAVEESVDVISTELGKEVYDTKTNAENIKKAFDDGVEGFGQEMVDSAEQAYDEALAAYETAEADGRQVATNFVNGFIDALDKKSGWMARAAKSALTAAINGVQNSAVSYSSNAAASGTAVSTYSITPEVPQLAKGAVLPANKPFMAMVGDQRHGTNVEAPLATIQEAVALVMQDQTSAILAGFQASVDVQRDILEAVLGISIGDDVICAAVDRYNHKMAIMKGGI